MGYMYCIGPCVACSRIFGFNPERVPSIRVRGEREPVCQDCMAKANLNRLAAGLEPHIIMPGAYNEVEIDAS